jgi:hypothetical protein
LFNGHGHNLLVRRCVQSTVRLKADPTYCPCVRPLRAAPS